jgi:hypothetical protein
MKKNTILEKNSMAVETELFLPKIIPRINSKNSKMDIDIVNIFEMATAPEPNRLIRQGASFPGKL